MALEHLIYASLGGILPALLWLHFWLKEDKKNPEPKKIIHKTFLFGMISVLLVLPLEKGVESLLPGTTFLTLFLWATIEEAFKFGAGYFGGLHSVEDNEPLDPIIYMITAALGFVALENTLFILGPLIGDDIPRGIMTANMRFIGASLLHVVASGIVGAAYAFSFYKSAEHRRERVRLGLLVAIVFHTIFNLMIINLEENGALYAFSLVWIGVIYILWAFEKSKSIAPPRY